MDLDLISSSAGKLSKELHFGWCWLPGCKILQACHAITPLPRLDIAEVAQACRLQHMQLMPLGLNLVASMLLGINARQDS